MPVALNRDSGLWQYTPATETAIAIDAAAAKHPHGPIPAVEVAKLVRFALKQEFPPGCHDHTKFCARTNTTADESTIDIVWADGPRIDLPLHTKLRVWQQGYDFGERTVAPITEFFSSTKFDVDHITPIRTEVA